MIKIKCKHCGVRKGGTHRRNFPCGQYSNVTVLNVQCDEPTAEMSNFLMAQQIMNDAYKGIAAVCNNNLTGDSVYNNTTTSTTTHCSPVDNVSSCDIGGDTGFNCDSFSTGSDGW